MSTIIPLSDSYETTKPRSEMLPFLRGDGAEYLLDVEKIEAKRPESPGGHPYILLTGKVLESSGPDSLPVGSTACYSITTARRYSYEQELREMLAAVFAMPYDSINKAGTQGVLSGQIPVKGKQVRARTFKLMNKKTGELITTKNGVQIYLAAFKPAVSPAG